MKLSVPEYHVSPRLIFFGQNLHLRTQLLQSSHCGSAVTYLTSIHEDAGLIRVPAQWIKDLGLPQAWLRSGVGGLLLDFFFGTLAKCAPGLLSSLGRFN